MKGIRYERQERDFVTDFTNNIPFLPAQSWLDCPIVRNESSELFSYLEREMSYPDREINLSTDARANKQAPPIEFVVNGVTDLARLRNLWSQLPSIPKLLVDRCQGEDNSWRGFDVRTLVRGEESSGRWAIHSIILAPGAEFSPHTFDGGAYVLVMDGEVSVTIGAQTASLRRGASAFAPAQTTLAIANRSTQPTSFFLVGPGEIVLVEDTFGKGHLSKAFDGLPRNVIFIGIAE